MQYSPTAAQVTSSKMVVESAPFRSFKRSCFIKGGFEAHIQTLQTVLGFIWYLINCVYDIKKCRLNIYIEKITVKTFYSNQSFFSSCHFHIFF